jgi:phenylacetate-CoA ligase
MNVRRLLLPKTRRDYAAATARRAAASADIALPRWQLDTIRKSWADATVEIPFYAELVAHGRAPKYIRSWDEFRQLPVLTRQALQDQPEAFLRRSGPPDSFMKTAGSTGTPLRLGLNQADRDIMRIVKLVEWQRFGYTLHSRLFLIWGHSHLLGTGWRGTVNHFKRKTADWLLGYQRVDAYRMDRGLCEEYARKLIAHRPLGVIGYASALDLFARYTTRFRDEYHALGVRFVLATSEPPPRPDSVALLEDLFGCPLVQEYGGAEFGQVAFKTGAAPFDVYSDLNHVECQPPEADDPGAHPLLLTSLYPRYLPLFRYRVGDAIRDPVLLEHGHVRRFGGLVGRVNDVITFEDGYSVHSVAIFHCIHQEPTVHNIQMLVRDDGIEIRLISSAPQETAVIGRIRQRLAQVHAPLAMARIVFVEDFLTNRAGKRHWFVDQRDKAILLR